MFLERVHPLTQLRKDIPDVAWSLKPIFIWMQIIGIHLIPSAIHSTLRRFSNLCFDLSMLLATIITRIYKFSVSIDGLSATNTQMLSQIMTKLHLDLSVIGIHIGMLTTALFKWRSLWLCIQQIEQVLQFHEQFYQKLRRFTLVTLVWIVLVTSPVENLTWIVPPNNELILICLRRPFLQVFSVAFYRIMSPSIRL